jgi:hypothetical protein
MAWWRKLQGGRHAHDPSKHTPCRRRICYPGSLHAYDKDRTVGQADKDRSQYHPGSARIILDKEVEELIADNPDLF